MFIFPKVFSKEYLQTYHDTIVNHYNNGISIRPDLWDDWQLKAMNLPIDDEIIFHTKSYLEKFLKIDLKCVQLEGQVWPAGGRVIMHRHTEGGRSNTLFNSMIYLNEDFEGGEFMTEYGVTVKPHTGMLTLFDGLHTMHGISPVKKQNRITLILWWSIDSVFN